jgi:hypothetical protein
MGLKIEIGDWNMIEHKKTFDVLVRYRTRSGCNAAYHTIEADSASQALRQAASERRARRGVVRIDSCQVCEWAEPESEWEPEGASSWW